MFYINIRFKLRNVDSHDLSVSILIIYKKQYLLIIRNVSNYI